MCLHLPNSLLFLRRSRKRRSSRSEEDQMDECAAAMVLMKLSCSPRSPVMLDGKSCQPPPLPNAPPQLLWGLDYIVMTCFYSVSSVCSCLLWCIDTLLVPGAHICSPCSTPLGAFSLLTQPWDIIYEAGYYIFILHIF